MARDDTAMRVALKPPVDLEWTLDRFVRYGDDPANRIEPDGSLVRVVSDGTGAPVAVRVGQAGDGIDVEASGPVDEVLLDRLRRSLGDAWDLAALAPVARREPALAAAHLGRPPLILDGFEALVTAITAQQVSMSAARGVRARLIATYGRAVGFAHAFPRAVDLAGAAPDDLRALGLSQRKAEYITGLATLVADGVFDPAALEDLDDEAVVEAICAIRGLGRWTAEWHILRTLGRPDSLPAGDLGVRKLMERLAGEPLDEAGVRRVGERLRPVRGLATMLLLRST
jgi:DNA-3-methyladenine glycosylase II